MRQRCGQGVECSRAERSRHGDTCARKLRAVLVWCPVACWRACSDRIRTQWLLLEEQEDSVNQLEVLGEVIELLPSH